MELPKWPSGYIPFCPTTGFVNVFGGARRNGSPGGEETRSLLKPQRLALVHCQCLDASPELEEADG